jgi:hypothetical protein
MKTTITCAVLGMLVLFAALISGCISLGGNAVWDHSPEVGTVIDTNEVIKISEKWRVQNFDGTFSYRARLEGGRELSVDPELYLGLPINVTGVGVDRVKSSFPVPVPEYTLDRFYPINVTPYQDVKNRVMVIP